jgi:mono/diheme cytochrome c family protein
LPTSVPLIALLAVLGLGACRQDMHDQPKYKTLRSSPFFDDGRTSRPRIEGTVARGELDANVERHTGRTAAGSYVVAGPLPVTTDLLRRGQERYDVFCSVCHDRAGTGRGMIVRRGFRQPESFHTDRLRQAPDGYVFENISNGFGVMPSYAAQIPVDDRWAITAYIRALQLSQRATLADVPAEARAELEARGAATPQGTQGKIEAIE